MRAVWDEQDQLVQQHGYTVQGVFGTAEHPSFTYTIGLSRQQWPEIIVVGMNPRTAGVILNTLVVQCGERGSPPAVGEVLTELANFPMAVGAVDSEHHGPYMQQALNYLHRHGISQPLQAVQLIMADRSGALPGSSTYDYEYMDPAQPSLAPGGKWRTAQ